MEKKTAMLLLSFVIIVIISGIGLLNYLGILAYPPSQVYCGSHQMIPHSYFLVFAVVIIFASIPIIYYFISKKTEQKLREHEETFLRIVNKNNLSGEKNILKFLNPIEQKIVQILLKNNGEMLQSQISKIEDLTKLKVHRVVKSLEQKKIVQTEHYGKTNKISLTKEIKRLL